MKKRLQIFGLVGVLSLSMFALPVPGGLIVFDPTNYGEALEHTINMIKTINQLKQTYEHAVYQARSMSGLGRYRTRTSLWQRLSRLPGGTVYPQVQVWIDAANTGIDAMGAYSRSTYGLAIPYTNLTMLSPAAKQRKELDVANIEMSDATGVGALNTVGQARYNAQQTEQMIRDVQNDITHDNPDNYTEAKQAQNANFLALVRAKILNDQSKMIMAQTEVQVLRMKRERDAEAYALFADVAFREHGQRAINDQIGDPSAALVAFRLH